jgi:hypothetical protein
MSIDLYENVIIFEQKFRKIKWIIKIIDPENEFGRLVAIDLKR